MTPRLFLAALLLLVNVAASAFQVPVSKMQNAVSGVTQAKMQSKGFTSADPRYVETLANQSSSVAGLVAGAATVTALGVTAPAWATILAATAVGVGVTLVVEAGVKWLFKDGNSVQIGDNPESVNTPAGLPPPSIVYRKGTVISASQSGACNGQPTTTGVDAGKSYKVWYAWTNGACETFRQYDGHGVLDMGPTTAPEKLINNTTLCPGISLSASAGKCPASNFPEPAPAPVKTISDAAADLTEPQKATALDPQIIADLANEFWKAAAAAPGYNGLPYDATQPITATDAATWQAANPSYWPSVGDFVAPQVAPSGGTATSPFTLPASPTPVSSADPTTQPNTGTNPSTEPLQNLGTDPGIGAPGLEAIPTAQQIIAPTQNIFPTLKSFVVPSIDAQCPTWDVPVLGKLISFKDHCALLEQARPNLYAAMAVIYALMALFIVLRT